MPGKNTISRRLPPAKVNSIIVEEDQTFSDILATLCYMHSRNKTNYDKIAAQFLGGSLRETCENLFDFCKNYIPHETETEELQTIKTPQRILQDAELGIGHDCKHYASFIGGCCDALRRQGYNINWCFRFASYRLFDTTPGHVFVVVKSREGEIWIDPVLDYFDERKKYQYSLDKCNLSSLGCCRIPGAALGAVVGADTKTETTIKSVGGTIVAVGATVAACIPAGTVVGAVIAVAGFAVTFIAGLFHDKYTFSTQVRWLCQQYQFRVLGMANVVSDNEVDERFVHAAQIWFALVLGVPMWDNLRYHTLAGTTSDTDKLSTDSFETCAKKYQSYGSIEGAINFNDCVNASRIAHTLNDHDPAGSWANYPPANIVLVDPADQGKSAEQILEEAAGAIQGNNPAGVPVSQINTLVYSPYLIPVVIAAGTGLLLLNNKKR